jgi:hypothetical protein
MNSSFLKYVGSLIGLHSNIFRPLLIIEHGNNNATRVNSMNQGTVVKNYCLKHQTVLI